MLCVAIERGARSTHVSMFSSIMCVVITCITVQIAVMADGAVVEHGTFDELMAIEDGHFKHMYNTQMFSKHH
jgi:ABC-type dipeptide/oligopeptide/nickel transport system ATPase component